jgi:hypothetical protein
MQDMVNLGVRRHLHTKECIPKIQSLLLFLIELR